MRIPYEAISREDYLSSFNNRANLPELHRHETYRVLVTMGRNPNFPNLPEFVSIPTYFERAEVVASKKGHVAVLLCLADNSTGASIFRLSGEIDEKNGIWVPDEETNTLGFYRAGSGLEIPTLSASTTAEIEYEARQRDNTMALTAVQGYLLHTREFNRTAAPIRQTAVKQPFRSFSPAPVPIAA